MKFIINDFEKLEEAEQQDIQDMVSGITSDWEIVERNHVKEANKYFGKYENDCKRESINKELKKTMY